MKHLIYIFTALILFSCSASDQKTPKNFDFGKTENGTYTNDYFNMKILFDSTWTIQDQRQMNDLVDQKSDLVIGDDKNLKAAIKSSKVNTAYLLNLSKYELGAPVEYNPSFLITAENTKNYPGIKSGKDYLFHAKKTLQQTQLDYSYEKPIYEKVISKTTFHVMEVELDYMRKLIIQEYFSTVTKGFSLTFVISYTTEEEKSELYQILDGIKI